MTDDQMVTRAFIRALENHDVLGMKQIPKGDLHNHGSMGGSLSILEALTGIRLKKAYRKFNNIVEMQQWITNHIYPMFGGKWGYETRTKAAFLQAKQDGISVIKMSIDMSSINMYENSVQKLVDAIENIHISTAPDIQLIPEIGIDRGSPISTSIFMVEKFLKSDFFKSIDLYGDELSQPISRFKDIYKEAKDRGLLLNAHVGEFGDAESVREAVEILKLDHVQHGIAAAYSKDVMKWLARNNIQLNICPASNVMLNRVSDYHVHPIRLLYDNGIRVTINTDDVLVFGKGVSEEYFTSHDAGLFTPMELDEIRRSSLLT